ncbi:MAG: hypothetical protein L0H64_04400, partial [Pseudonocardia sp.]|nr:hypothetical protein [Pseudonocardia sp.]
MPLPGRDVRRRAPSAGSSGSSPRCAAAVSGAGGQSGGHRGLDSAPLDIPVAAVELINLVRPIVAALALHEHPHARERARD